MRFGRQKRHRKIVRFYTACFGFREPYKILCDGTFVHHLLVNNIMPADTALSTTLGADVKLFTTRCVLAELASLGKSHFESLKAARNLSVARCDHDKRIAAEDCLKEIIGNRNHEHFFVATQDDKLRKKLQEVAAVPEIFGLRNSLYLEKPSAFQRQLAKSNEEERSHMSQSENKILAVNQTSGSALEEATKLPDATGGSGGVHASSGRKRPDVGGVLKRKKAKAPNPLSCKKKKDHMHANIASENERGETTETLRSRKRKRSRRSQILTNYGGWKAAAVGANNQAAQSMLKQDYKDDITREEAVQLALKVLSKTMDSTSLTSDKLELAEVFLSPSGKVKYQVSSPEALDRLLVSSGLTQPAAEAS